MCVIRWFLLKSCIFGIYILATDASVSLQTFDGGKVYLKDSAVTLVCNITPYNNEMTWYVDNDPYAGCFLGICAPSANKPYTFKFTFDETTGLFNLTIDTVNYSHAELSFACDDGNVRETISFNVTTDNEQNGSERSNGGNGDKGAIVGGGVAGGVGVIGAASLMGIAGYKRYKKYTKRKEIEKKCNIEAPTLTECTVTSTQVALSWTQPYWNGNAPLEYNVVLNQNEPYKTDKTSYTINDLIPGKAYTVKVYTLCEGLISLPLERTVTTPVDKPSNLEASTQPNLIDLEWEKPVYTGDQKLDYEVTCDGVFKGKTNNTTYRIGDCIPGKTYEIKIFTIINGIKSLALVKNVRTQPSQPKELPPLKVGQLKALPMEMSNSVQFVSEEGFAQNHSNRQRRNNAVDHRPDF